MIKRILVASFIFVSMTAVAQKQSADPFGLEGSEKTNDFLSALSSAYAAANEKRLIVSGKTVVIASRGKYIVISFVSDGRSRGGQSHFVYDPQLRRVVYVLGED